MRHRPLLLALALFASACDFAHGSEPTFYEGVPADLKVRQVPANPVRAGTLVRLTATYGDSLNPNAYVTWFLRGGTSIFGRSVEWRVPLKDTTYINSVSVKIEGFPGASRGFAVVVIP